MHAFETVDLDAFDSDGRYKFLTATVVPRPIALVSSLSADGAILNAAPFSQFIILSQTPAILGVVIGQSRGEKDSYRNIRDRGECVVNTVNRPLATKVQQCAFPFDSAVSELDMVGLTAISSDVVAVPRIAESPVHFECRLQRIERFGRYSTLMALDVVRVHARFGMVNGHRVDHQAYDPLGRIAGRQYCTTENVIDMPNELDAPFAGMARI